MMSYSGHFQGSKQLVCERYGKTVRLLSDLYALAYRGSEYIFGHRTNISATLNQGISGIRRCMNNDLEKKGDENIGCISEQ